MIKSQNKSSVCSTIHTNLKTNTTGYRRLSINNNKTALHLLVSIAVLSVDRHLIAQILNSSKSSFSNQLAFGAIFLTKSILSSSSASA